jgi:hypothetical protein
MCWTFDAREDKGWLVSWPQNPYVKYLICLPVVNKKQWSLDTVVAVSLLPVYASRVYTGMQPDSRRFTLITLPETKWKAVLNIDG